MRLSARVGDRLSGQGWRQSLDHLLQPPAAPCRPWRAAARRGLLQPDQNRPAGAESSLNHPGNCPRVGEQLIPGRDELKDSFYVDFQPRRTTNPSRSQGNQGEELEGAGRAAVARQDFRYSLKHVVIARRDRLNR